jgi:hypothetical protein
VLQGLCIRTASRMRQCFRTDVRIISGMKQCFSLVIGENSLYSLQYMGSRSRQWPVLFSNTSVEMRQKDYFNTHPSSSKMVAIMAAEVSSVYKFLAYHSTSHLQYHPGLEKTFGTNAKLFYDLMLSPHLPQQFINFCRHTTMLSFILMNYHWSSIAVWPEAISSPNLNGSTHTLNTTYFVFNIPTRRVRFNPPTTIILAVHGMGNVYRMCITFNYFWHVPHTWKSYTETGRKNSGLEP